MGTFCVHPRISLCPGIRWTAAAAAPLLQPRKRQAFFFSLSLFILSHSPVAGVEVRFSCCPAASGRWVSPKDVFGRVSADFNAGRSPDFLVLMRFFHWSPFWDSKPSLYWVYQWYSEAAGTKLIRKKRVFKGVQCSAQKAWSGWLPPFPTDSFSFSWML